MKVGVLTYHRAHNYGAYLQAFALQQAISNIPGCNAEIIDYESKKIATWYKKTIFQLNPIKTVYFFRRYIMFRQELKKLELSEMHLVSDDLEKFNQFLDDKYDVIVVGSDEVWKTNGERGFPNAYWLPNIKNCIKASFAASSRNVAEELDENTISQMKEYLGDFAFISVRDVPTLELINSLIGPHKQCYLMCDPTMTYDFKKIAKKIDGHKVLKQKFRISEKKKCVALLDSTGSITEIVKKNAGQDVEVVSLCNYSNGARNNPTITPFEWVAILSAVDGVISTFYHGMCLAINLDTPFLYCEERAIINDKYSKAYDLLNRYGLEESYINIGREKSEHVEKKISEFMTEIRNNLDFGSYSFVTLEEQKKYVEFEKMLVEAAHSI